MDIINQKLYLNFDHIFFLRNGVLGCTSENQIQPTKRKRKPSVKSPKKKTSHRYILQNLMRISG